MTSRQGDFWTGKCTYQGAILPLFRKPEHSWPNPVRAVLYIMGLGWCFLGIAIISDVFMASIERITARKKQVKNPRTGRLITVRVWNETMANLTLMALGSSAPEILLSLIEIVVMNEMHTGDLGPSTIIGSAAFNLLCISAVCVCAIPSPDVRKIKGVAVYVITASCSILAYIWLLAVVMVFTPHRVTVFEGILTLLFFPLLLCLAYTADQGCFCRASNDQGGSRHQAISKSLTHDELAQIEKAIREEHGAHLTTEQVMKIMDVQFFGKKSRAYYRHCAVTQFIGGKKKILPKPSPELISCVGVSEALATTDDVEKEMAQRAVEIGFSANKYAIMESAGHVKLPLLRTGLIDKHASVKYKTRDGTAKKHTDYIPVEGTAEFKPGETEAVISISIVDDTTYEDDEEFYVDLSEPMCPGEVGCLARLSDIYTTTVLIIDDDQPGTLRFQQETLEVPESDEDVVVNIMVERCNGATGTVGCSYFTEDDDAIANYDYKSASGKVTFLPGQQTATIPITIIKVGRYEQTEKFRLILHEPFGEAVFDKNTDGGDSQCICTITITADQCHKQTLERMMTRVNLNWNKLAMGHSNWKSQFKSAILVDRDEDDDDADDNEKGSGGPATMDYVMHVVSVPWKLLFACVPPPDFFNGWACFVCSLGMIAVVTALVGDMANLVGCCLGMPTEVAAITLVALGTSLPDTFASKSAAQFDPYADASIGNITGSNSVNVFLGLGLPWTFASIYWHLKTDDSDWLSKFDAGGPYFEARHVLHNELGGKCCAFMVPAGSLWFNLTVFSMNAVCAIGLLAFRRRAFKGELGGPFVPKVLSAAFLVTQWFIYISLSSWRATNK